VKPAINVPGPRYSCSIEILRLSEALWNASRVFLSRWDLSPSQFNILNLLRGETAGCTQIELSRQLITHRSNVTGLVDRLAARGLVERRNVPGDRRAFNIVLTTAGKKLMRRIQPHYYQAAEQIWSGLSIEDAKALVSKLATVARNAEGVAQDGIKKSTAEQSHEGGAYVRAPSSG